MPHCLESDISGGVRLLVAQLFAMPFNHLIHLQVFQSTTFNMHVLFHL